MNDIGTVLFALYNCIHDCVELLACFNASLLQFAHYYLAFGNFVFDMISNYIIVIMNLVSQP